MPTKTKNPEKQLNNKTKGPTQKDLEEIEELEKESAEEMASIDLSVMPDSFHMFMAEASRYKLLTAEEEVELGEKALYGDKKAREDLINANYRLVAKIAFSYRTKGLPLDDLLQEGCIGLITAADKFDYRKGYKFSTYAVWWIRQGILRALATKSNMIRLPVYAYGHLQRMRRFIVLYKERYGENPKPEYIAKKLDLSIELVNELFLHNGDLLSLDVEIGDEKDSVLADFIADRPEKSPESSYLRTDLKENLCSVMEDSLSEREIEIVKKRFGFDGTPRTLEEIGSEIGLTRERIRQIEKQALRKLKKKGKARSLMDYLY